MDSTKKIKITKYDGRLNEEAVRVPVEKPVTLIVNDQELVKVMITPDKIREFAIGFLFGQGIIKKLADIKTELVGEKKGILYFETKKPVAKKLLAKSYVTTGCGGGVSFKQFSDIRKLDKTFAISLATVLNLMKEFVGRGEVYRISGGVHACGLASKEELIFLSEDVGRHNATDKILGSCLINKINTSNKIIFTTGRISFEMIPKVARAKIPVIVSRSSPTNLAVSLAEKLGVTLIGYARSSKANVYTHPSRIIELKS